MKHPLKHKKPVKRRGHSLPHLWRELECLKMTAADLQASVDALTAQVAQTVADIAALKAKPELITQAQLDANTQAVTDATTALKNA